MSIVGIGYIAGFLFALFLISWVITKVNVKMGVWSEDDFGLKKCPVCKSKNSHAYYFCGNCGTRLKGE